MDEKTRKQLESMQADYSRRARIMSEHAKELEAQRLHAVLASSDCTQRAYRIGQIIEADDEILATMLIELLERTEDQ
jgi:hypothetical protein